MVLRVHFMGLFCGTSSHHIPGLHGYRGLKTSGHFSLPRLSVYEIKEPWSWSDQLSPSNSVYPPRAPQRKWSHIRVNRSPSTHSLPLSVKLISHICKQTGMDSCVFGRGPLKIHCIPGCPGVKLLSSCGRWGSAGSWGGKGIYFLLLWGRIHFLSLLWYAGHQHNSGSQEVVVSDKDHYTRTLKTHLAMSLRSYVSLSTLTALETGVSDSSLRISVRIKWGHLCESPSMMPATLWVLNTCSFVPFLAAAILGGRVYFKHKLTQLVSFLSSTPWIHPLKILPSKTFGETRAHSQCRALALVSSHPSTCTMMLILMSVPRPRVAAAWGPAPLTDWAGKKGSAES